MSAPTYRQSVIPVRIKFFSCTLSRELVTTYWSSRYCRPWGVAIGRELLQVMRQAMALADTRQHLMQTPPGGGGDLHTTVMCSIDDL